MSDNTNTEISFDDLPEFEEEYTDDEIAKAGGGQKCPVGKLHVTCIGLAGEEARYMTPPCFASIIKMKVNYAIEIEGKPVEKDTGLEYAGCKMNDKIFMPKAGEKDYLKNRRAHIGKALRILSEQDKVLTNAKIKSLLNKDFIINTEAQMKKDPVTNEYTIPTGYTQVKMFGGYEYIPNESDMKPPERTPEEKAITVDDI